MLDSVIKELYETGAQMGWDNENVTQVFNFSYFLRVDVRVFNHI